MNIVFQSKTGSIMLLASNDLTCCEYPSTMFQSRWLMVKLACSFSECFSLLVKRQSIASIKCIFFSFFIMFHVFVLLLDPALKSTTGRFFYCCRQPTYSGTFQITDKRNALYNAVS